MSLAAATRRARDERGFTIVELLVVLPMLTLLLGGLVVTLDTLNRWNDRTREATSEQTAVRAAIGTFVADVRGAYPVDPGNGVALPIVTATSTALEFYSPDRTATTASGSSFHLRKIAYQFTATQLLRQQITSTNAYQVLTGTSTWAFPSGTFPSSTAWIGVLGPPDGENVSGAFTYYDASGSTLTAPVTNIASIASVGITVTTSTGGQQPAFTTYRATATLRETESG